MTDRRQALRALAMAGIGAIALPLAAAAQEAAIVKRGAFAGQSGHATAGSAAIVAQNGDFFVSLGRDFSFDGAPDPKVALGRNGYRSETLLGPLAADRGAQSYPIPRGIDAAAHNEIWIWCEEFDVPLGVARLR
jgi:hypothetical protein